MIIPTFIDLCTKEEIEIRCEHILQTISEKKKEIQKENEKNLRGSRSLDDETPFLPSHYLITNHNNEKKVLYSFLFLFFIHAFCQSRGAVAELLRR